MVVYIFRKTGDTTIYGELLTDNTGTQDNCFITQTPSASKELVELGFNFNVEPTSESFLIQFAQEKGLTLDKMVQDGNNKMINLVANGSLVIPLDSIALTPAEVTIAMAAKDTPVEVTIAPTPDDAYLPQGFEVAGTIAGVEITLSNKTVTVNATGVTGAISGSVTIVSKDYPAIQKTLAISITA